MLGAILGDVIGSTREYNPIKTEEFELFPEGSYATDDSILTIATAESILKNKSFQESYLKWGNKYPNAGYGNNFRDWLRSDNPMPYNSFGNGSAMRVSSIGWLYNDMGKVMEKAEESAIITHNHDEGIIGASATALCIYLARMKTPKKIIKEVIETYYEYDLNRTIEQIRPTYKYDITCQGTVPESIICFLESNGFEDAIRKAISLGGDADTQAAITGSIAEAYYGIPVGLKHRICKYLDEDMIKVLKKFYDTI